MCCFEPVSGPERQILWNRRTDRWRSRVCCSEVAENCFGMCRRQGHHSLSAASSMSRRTKDSHFLRAGKKLSSVEENQCSARRVCDVLPLFRQHEVPMSNEIYDFIIFRGKAVLRFKLKNGIQRVQRAIKKHLLL